MAGAHARAAGVFLAATADPRPGPRKRATHALAALAPALADEPLAAVVDGLLARGRAGRSGGADAVAALAALAALTRAAGWRFGAACDKVLPVALAALAEGGEEEADDERREAALAVLEAAATAAPAAAAAHVPAAFDAALSALAHDPNVADDGDGWPSDDDGGDEFDDERGFSDDGDASWRVRRAAAKALTACLAASPTELATLYPRAAGALVARFREREEAVRADVFGAYADLVARVAAAAAAHAPGGDAAAAALAADVPAAAAAEAKALADRSPATRAAALAAATALARASPDAVAEAADVLLPGVVAALADAGDSAACLKAGALAFVGAALARGPADVWRRHAGALAPPVAAAAGDRFYAVAAAALRALAAVLAAARPAPAAGAAPPPGLAALASTALCAIAPRLTGADVDSDVRAAAVAAAAELAARAGDALGAELTPLLSALLDRLRSPAQAPAARALARVAASPLALDLAPVAEPAAAELAAMLRLAARPARAAALAALAALAARVPLSDAAAAAAVAGAAPCVDGRDLGLAAAALGLATTLLRGGAPGAAATVVETMLPPALALASSPLLQGPALVALQDFLVAASAGAGADPVAALLAAGAAPDALPAVQRSIAACVAAVAASGGAKSAAAAAEALAKAAAAPRAAAPARRVALLALGALGRRSDLSSLASVTKSLEMCLADADEGVAAAAATAAGGAAAGAPATLLPFVVGRVHAADAGGRAAYLALRALNEALTGLGAEGAPPLPPRAGAPLAALLLDRARAADGEARALAAEGLGALARLDPGVVLPALAEAAAARDAPTRAAAAAAVRHAVPGAPPALASALAAGPLPAVLALLSDPDHHVRKAAVQALSGAAHAAPALARPHLPTALPALHALTAVDESLVRVVTVGPFTHRVDDGLDLRKAAFEAIDVLLDGLPPDALDMPAFMAALRAGLADHVDVKLPCLLTLGRVAAAAPGAVLPELDALAPLLDAVVTATVKSTAVKQEIDRNDDLVRAALRAADALARVPGAGAAPAFGAWLTGVVAGPAGPKLAAVRAEREAEGKGVRAGAGGGAADRMDTT